MNNKRGIKNGYPDFRAGGAIMGHSIGGIFKLAGHKAPRDAARQLRSAGNRTRHTFRTGCQHHFRAVSAHQGDAFSAHGIRHDNDAAIASRRSQRRQGNTHITGGRLNDGATGCQHSPFFRIFQNIFRSSIFSLL